MTSFDERAKTWDDDPKKVARAQEIADAIRAELPAGGLEAAFEYGCGTGLLSFALQSSFGRITLADSSQGMLDVLREKIAAGGVRAMSAIKLDLSTDPLPAMRYDAVYTAMALHHVPDTERLLRSFHALLKEGGRLWIIDLDAEDGSFHGAGFNVHCGFERDELASKATAAGFTDLRFKTVHEIMKPIEGGAMGTFPVFLMSARKA